VQLWLLIAHRVTYLHDTWVTLPLYVCEELGIGEDARTDGLKYLEEAGLIAVHRPPGGYLKVRMTWREKRGRKLGREVIVPDLDLEVRQLNAIDEPLLYRIGVAGLISHYGRETVRDAFIREAERSGVASIAQAPHWREPRRSPALKAG
jgi:hypothetical protein